MDHLSGLYQLEFSLLTVAAGVAAIGSPLVVNFLNQLPPACQGTLTQDCLSTWQLLLTPMVPLLLLMAFGYLYFYSRVVGSYTRDLERAVSGDVRQPGGRLHVPALSRLNSALFGGESPPLLPLRIFFALLAGTVALVSIAAAVLPITRVNSPDWQIVGWAAYGTLGIVCFLAYNAAASHRLHERLRDAARKRDEAKARAGAPVPRPWPWPNFLAFTLLPRYASVQKAVHAVAIALTVAAVSGEISGFPWLRFGLGMLVFEVVLYQTRYLLNGVREDPSDGLQLPGNRNDPPKRFTALQGLTALVVAAARMVLFYVLATWWNLLPARPGLVLVGLFLVAFYVYEAPRELARVRYRRLCAQQASKQQSGPTDQELQDLCRRELALGRVLFATVGAGYAVRATAALMLANGGHVRLLPDGLAVVIAWVLGSALVGGGWAREFTGAVARSGRAVTLHPGIAAKPHVLWMGRVANPFDLGHVSFKDLALADTEAHDTGPLGDVSNVRYSPWRIAWVVAFGCIGLLAPPGQTPVFPLAVLTLGVAAYAFFKGGVSVWRPPLIPVVTALGCAVIAAGSGISWWWAVAVPGLATLASYAMHASEKGAFADLRKSSQAANTPVVVGKPSRFTTVLETAGSIVLGGAFVRSAPRVFGRVS